MIFVQRIDEVFLRSHCSEVVEEVCCVEYASSMSLSASAAAYWAIFRRNARYFRVANLLHATERLAKPMGATEGLRLIEYGG